MNELKTRIFKNPITTAIGIIAAMMGVPSIQQAQEKESLTLLLEGVILFSITIWGLFAKDSVKKEKN